MTDLIRRAQRFLAHNLNPAADGVHFHTGPVGQAYPCDDPHCTAPHRDPAD